MKPLAQYQEVAVAKFLEMLPVGAKRILEIGSDVEYAVVDNIAGRFKGTITGINPTPGFVRRLPQDGPSNVTILEEDGCNMPFDDGSFDAILSIATMEHVLDLPKFLEESHRVLKSGGIFYTNFSPIWSSGIGHHVCAFAGRKEARFWKPDRNPLPDFSHLIWDESEMREYLLDSPYDDRLIEPIIDWVYRSDNINRCFYEDYIEAFQDSSLNVTTLSPGVFKSPSTSLLEALQAKYGRHREFSYDSIETVLSKPMMSRRLHLKKQVTTSLQLQVLPSMNNDDSRIIKTEHFSGGGSHTMIKTSSHVTDTAVETGTAHRITPEGSPQRRFSQEELLVMTNRRMGQFKNKHKGQRCVIIGNGPSLNKMDLSFLENEITFGMNRIFLMYDKWNFRPTYYVSVNPLVIEQSAKEILNINVPKFLSHKGIPFFDDPGDIHFLQSIPQWFFSKDPRNGICEGWTVTYVAMQLAYFMGFDEVVLIGVDHHFVTQGDPNKEIVSEGDDPNHFHPGYFGKGVRWHLPDLEHSEGSYRMAKEAYETESRIILDATVDGKLTIFPKADYRELFYKNQSMPYESTNVSQIVSTNGYRTAVSCSNGLKIESYKDEAAPLRFSVITPSFNQGVFIEQTILSVLDQNYQNFEHIVIDGGSKDGTLETLKKYAHLCWISEEDRGQSHALNKGFLKATGEIVAWINSDDWYEPGIFSTVADFFQHNPDKNIVMGNCNLVDARGIIFDTVINHDRGIEELKQHWISRSIPTQPAIFFRKKLLDEFGTLDESLHFAMDYDLWMRFATKYRFFHLNLTVANYRFHSAAKGGDQDWSRFIPEWQTICKRYCSPAVSVIIPCYNYAHYLSEAVSSVIEQSFQDFEIIIVNDGSTDNSQEVAEKLIASLPNCDIRLINTPNSGNPAFPRNTGVKASHGNYILFLDADDKLMTTFLEECTKILDENPAISVVYTDQIYFNDKNSQVVSTYDYDFSNLLNANFMAYCSLFRRKVWEDVGGVPTDVGYEDWDFWIMSGLSGHIAQRIPKPLFCYRQHDTGRFKNDLILRDNYLKAQIVLKHRNVYQMETVRLAEKTVALSANELNPFRVIALISAHNEGDVIYHVISDLVQQGVEVYLINHCSTDNTVEEASKWLGKGLIHIENFPQDACYPEENREQYIWHHILRRKEELAAQLDADWFIHSDADEFRESPWQGLSLKNAIRVADSMGYNALDFELLNFRPVNNCFVPGTDVRKALRHYEGCEDFNSYQIKAWKNLKIPVNIFQSGGHSIAFEGRKVCPTKFLLRHYPIRSQAHGEQKVFNERKLRFNAEERNVGWHVQYDTIRDESHNFLHDQADLTLYDGDAVRLRILSAQAYKTAASLDAAETKSDSYISSAGLATGNEEKKKHTEVNITQIIEKANVLANAGYFTKATQHYQQALDLEPENPLALVGIGVVNIIEGQYTEAGISFSKALKFSPINPKALCGLGLARSKQGRRCEGFELFKKALDNDQENLTALNELLTAAYELNRLSEAESYLEGYLRYHPADIHMLFSLAGLRFRLGKHLDALDSLEKVLVFEPEYEGGIELAEQIHAAMESPESEPDISSPTSINSRCSQMCSKANTLAGRGKANEAERIFRQVLVEDPENCTALLGVGVLKTLEKNYAEAEIAFSNAVRISPENTNAICGLGIVHSTQGKQETAFELFKSALVIDAGNLTAIHELLKSAYELERFEEAEPLLKEYLKHCPTDSHIQFSLAGLNFKMGNYYESLDVLENLRTLKPDYEGGAELAEMNHWAITAGNGEDEVRIAVGA